MKISRCRYHAGLAFLILVLLNGWPVLRVQAEENVGTEEAANVQGSLMTAAVRTEGKEKPEENAAVVVELPKGAYILVTGPEENGWFEIFYQNQTAYVPAAALTASDVLDGKALEEEMQKIAEEDSAFIESLEIQRSAISRSRTWRLVIIILIAAVFGVGIVSALRKTKSAGK